MAQTPLTLPPTLYFGYGSNLWQAQMTQRCPSSTYLGIARLDNYRWMINSRGYANVVEVSTNSSSSTSSADQSHDKQIDNKIDYSSVVYGLVYTLSPTDEAALDINEGVPVAYEKEMLEVEFWDRRRRPRSDLSLSSSDSALPSSSNQPSFSSSSSSSSSSLSSPDFSSTSTDTSAHKGRKEKMLVYIDRNRTVDAKPKKEYVYRMNMGILDALSEGVPKGYVEGVLRRFVPAEQRDEEDVRALAEKQALAFKDESQV